MESVILHKDQRLITLPSEKVEEMDRELTELRQIIKDNKIVIETNYASAYNWFRNDWRGTISHEMYRSKFNVEKGKAIDLDIDSLIRPLKDCYENNVKFEEELEKRFRDSEQLLKTLGELNRQLFTQKLLPLWLRKLWGAV